MVTCQRSRLASRFKFSLSIIYYLHWYAGWLALGRDWCGVCNLVWFTTFFFFFVFLFMTFVSFIFNPLRNQWLDYLHDLMNPGIANLLRCFRPTWTIHSRWLWTISMYEWLDEGARPLACLILWILPVSPCSAVLPVFICFYLSVIDPLHCTWSTWHTLSFWG